MILEFFVRLRMLSNATCLLLHMIMYSMMSLADYSIYYCKYDALRPLSRFPGVSQYAIRCLLRAVPVLRVKHSFLSRFFTY